MPLLKRLSNFYIHHAGLIGIFYCALPSIAWFLYALVFFPVRPVYLLRLGLCLFVGCPLAALINKQGVEMWLAKHRGATGPATIVDGMFNGAAVGIGIAFLPTLTSLIASNHPDMAKAFVIVTYITVVVLGGIMGSAMAFIGRRYLD
ncbi:hypothetical protein ACFL27_17475 [candidate division CSSED10-310 bacterium]|uniref:Uncharacterized protein n=1 Tax=candidate division CSSED10-310 bacterium TaxID=2855610 RepID=A0ABV6Z0Y0_UNCC1